MKRLCRCGIRKMADRTGNAWGANLELETAARTEVQPRIGQFGWPTLGLFAGILLGLGSVAWLTLAGALPYWLAIAINTVLIYFIFTPIHEAAHGNIAGRHKQWRWLELLIGH